MVNCIKGDLLKSNCDYICHQVNCFGVMGSGIAKQIREKWPDVYSDYKTFCDGSAPDNLLGKVQISYAIGEPNVINMFSQSNYGYDGQRYTSYDAFADCLELIKKTVPGGSTIGFPKSIGCGLGGGNWDIVSAMIEAILGNEFDVYIYEWEG